MTANVRLSITAQLCGVHLRLHKDLGEGRLQGSGGSKRTTRKVSLELDHLAPLPLLPSLVSAKKRAGPFRRPESRGQGWGKPHAAVSAGGQDAWVLKEQWNVESSQGLRIQRLKSCEGVRRGAKGTGPPGWYQRGKQLQTAWGLGHKMLFR